MEKKKELTEEEKNQIKELNDKGINYARNNQYEKALEYFDEILKIDSENIKALNDKGTIYRFQRKYEKSIEIFDKVFEIDKKNVYALNNKGQAYMELGKIKEAIECFDKVFKIDSNDIYSLNNMGVIYGNKKEYEKALEYFKRVLKIDAKDNDALNNILEIDGFNVNALNNKGKIYIQMKEYKKSIDCFDKVLYKEPENIEALNNKARVYEIQKKIEKQNECLDKIKKIKKSNNVILYLKFCSCKKFAEDVCSGNLYLNTIKYFREQEEKNGNHGQGDKNELITNIGLENHKLGNIEKKQVFSSNLKIYNSNNDLKLIVCFVRISLLDIENLSISGNNNNLFLFSDIDYNRMIEDFGEYCVIIEAEEFESKIKKSCNEKFKFQKVMYCEENRIDRILAIKDNQSIFFYKDEDFKYQREHRLVLGGEMPKDHFIHIGKLENAEIITADKLKAKIINKIKTFKNC